MTNWVGGVLPGPGDDVVINAAAGVTVVHSGGNDSVKSLVSANALALSGGTLTVADTIKVNNTFTINGGTLAHATILPGSGGQTVTFTPLGGTLDGVTAAGDLDLATNNRQCAYRGWSDVERHGMAGQCGRFDLRRLVFRQYARRWAARARWCSARAAATSWTRTTANTTIPARGR